MVSASSVRTGMIGTLIVISLAVLILSAHVNTFMGFFYVADRFPFVMSVITLAIVGTVSILQFISRRTPIARPVVEVITLGALLVAWTGANAFSTMRWQGITPGVCSSISGTTNPAFTKAARLWCNEIQALRAFIWAALGIVSISFWTLLGYCIMQTMRGSGQVWLTPLAVYESPSSRWRSGKNVFSQFSFESPGDNPPYPFDMRANGSNASSSVKHTINESSSASQGSLSIHPFGTMKGKGRAITPDPVPEIIIQQEDDEGPSNNFTVSRQPSTYPY